MIARAVLAARYTSSFWWGLLVGAAGGSAFAWWLLPGIVEWCKKAIAITAEWLAAALLLAIAGGIIWAVFLR